MGCAAGEKDERAVGSLALGDLLKDTRMDGPLHGMLFSAWGLGTSLYDSGTLHSYT